MPRYALRIAVSDEKLVAQIRDARGRYISAQKRLREAHQKAVTELTNATIRNLTERATKRTPDTRAGHPRLASVLSNPSVSKVYADGFDFLIDSRVKAISARAWKYYRVIEGGPGTEVARWWWVNKTQTTPFGLLFFGPGGPGGQQGRGSWVNAKFPRVHITTPQPEYFYIQSAIDEFIRRNRARELVVETLHDAGISVS